MPPVLAMPPPIYYRYLLIGLVLVGVAAAALVWWPVRRHAERDRRAGLGVAATGAGPLVGLGFALIAEATGTTSPVDVVYQRWTLGIFGLLVGVGAGVFFVAAAALARNDSKPAKPGHHELD